MKRMILASLIGLSASAAFASDLNYGGPYSQMKVKLCSDTPPSRSILPDGSLICDDNPPTNDTYCIGGFVYADTDIFNCGSQVDQDGDLNNNGRPDNEEDWDGDGLANGVDPNPTLNDNVEIDEDKNGIPDRLEPFFETYKASRAEVIKCDAQDPNCKSSNTAIYSLANMNRELTNIVNLMASTSSVDKKFQRTLTNLSQTLTYQEAETRRELRDLQHAVNNAGGDDSGLIRGEFRDVDAQFADVETNFDDLDTNVFQMKGEVSEVKFKANEILTAIENTNGVGLTATQKRQLKNAAKASSNNTKLNDVKNYTSDTNRQVSQIKDQVNTTLGAVASQAKRFSYIDGKIAALDGQFSSLNGRLDMVDGSFSQLNAKLDNLDVDANVDLSGVESKIDGLSEKIDGLASGGDGQDLGEVVGAVNGVADGVAEIGELLKGVDASKAGIDGTCIQGGTCQGFYESAYEEDLSAVVGGQLDAMKTSIVDPFVSSFGNIDLSGAQRPKFGLPVPFYGYMSFDDYIDMDWIFGFLRFIFLASTAFYCRQIIFGG